VVARAIILQAAAPVLSAITTDDDGRNFEAPRSADCGGTGQIKSQRFSVLWVSRLGQSPLSRSFHFTMFALRPYFSMSLRTL
jgi:hypothetical protein